jgi:hypothetical protein
MVFAVMALDGRVLDRAVHAVDARLVHGWLGVVNRCPNPFASQVVSNPAPVAPFFYPRLFAAFAIPRQP